MIRLAFRGLLSRTASSLLALAGLLTAILGFVVLVSTSATTSAVIVGDLERGWHTPYDILVRPAGSTASLEEQRGMVRPNFLGGLTGGISEHQLEAIRSIREVAVAAPVAVAGFYYLYTFQPVDLVPQASGAKLIGFRLTQTRTADAGLSTFPAESSYVLAAPSGTLRVEDAPSSVRSLEVQGMTVPCPASISCAAPRVCQGEVCTTNAQWIIAGASFGVPVVVAGVDPQAEAQLAGLDHCVTDGRYFNPLTDVPQIRLAQGQRLGSLIIPTLMAQHTPVDETVSVTVDRASEPSVSAAGSPTLQGEWQPMGTERWSSDQFYRTIFQTAAGVSSFSNSFTPGDVTYRGAGTDLTATTIPAQPGVYVSTATGLIPGQQPPPDALDAWFRPITSRPAADFLHGGAESPLFSPIGQFDADCLARFNPLAGGRLETYAPAVVTLSDGKTLRPNASLAGYVNSPPTALTTLAGIRALESETRYVGGPGNSYLSAVRVRVQGAQTIGPTSEGRLSQVAAAIKEATGLQVDILKGASPLAVTIHLPAGRFGRPALAVNESWSVKGVSFVFARALSAQNLALFAAVLLAAAVLVGQTAYTFSRRRRREFGVLRALGWPAWRIAALVEVEMLILASTAAALALLAGAVILALLRPGLNPAELLLAAPLAWVVAFVASLPPALSARQGTVIEVIRRPARMRRSRRLSGALHIGVLELLSHWRWEAILGVGAVALGASLVGGIVLITAAFRGQLDSTVMGLYLAGQVRSFHVAISVLTLAVGAIAVAEVIGLSYLERRSQLATLRALGWPRVKVAALLAVQALGLGLAGGLIGAMIIMAASILIAAPVAALLLAMLAAVGSAMVAAAVAASVPVAQAYIGAPASALRGE